MSYRGVIPHMFAEQARRQSRLVRGAKALGVGAGGFALYDTFRPRSKFDASSLPEGTSFKDPNAYFFNKRIADGTPQGKLGPIVPWYLDPWFVPRKAAQMYADPFSGFKALGLMKSASVRLDDYETRMVEGLDAIRSQKLASSLFARNHKESSGKDVKKKADKQPFLKKIIDNKAVPLSDTVNLKNLPAPEKGGPFKGRAAGVAFEYKF